MAGRIQAIEILGSIDSPEVVTVLEKLLHPRLAEPVQLAALRALGEQSGPDVGRVLAGAWRGWTPAVRAQAAEVVLGRKDRLGPLLGAIRAGQVPADAFDPAQRARLLGSSDRAVAAAAKAVFGEASRKLDPKLFEKYKGALDLRGDPARGSVTFKKLCITCHKAGGEGAEVGPHLASVRNRPRDQVLRDILYPSMTFAPQYHQYVVATNDGRLITGLLVASSATSYTIRRQGGEEVTVLRKDVEELSDTQISLMPEKLLDTLSPQEVADLLEFVKQAE
jgi:putative heme-binding domain-containing protein